MNKMLNSFVLLGILYSTVCMGQPEQYIVTGEHKARFKGNEFTYEMLGMKDTVYLIDPVTGQEISKIIDVAQVTTVNGKKIYDLTEVIAPPLTDNVSGPLEEYLLNSLIKELWLLKLGDGIIRCELYDIVVDEYGRIIYWDEGGLRYLTTDNTTRSLGDGGKINELLANYPPIKPFELNGAKVPVRLNASLLRYSIVLKDHTATYTRGNLFSSKH